MGAGSVQAIVVYASYSKQTIRSLVDLRISFHFTSLVLVTLINKDVRSVWHCESL